MDESVEPSHQGWPSRIVWQRDRAGTVFAIQLHRTRLWDDAFLEPPPLAVADVGIVTLEAGEAPEDTPPWLAVAVSSAPEVTEEQLLATASTLWEHAPHFREPGLPPEAYLDAGLRALCAPYAPETLGLGNRNVVAAFVQGRPDPLGRLADLQLSAFERWLHVCWPTPAAFERTIMLARMLDAGAERATQAIRRVDVATFESDRFLLLAEERDRLAERLDPARYFLGIPDFDVAVADAEAWWARYAEAYAGHQQHVAAMAERMMSELLPAIAAAEVLRVLNRDGDRPTALGGHALARLEAAVAKVLEFTREPATIPIPGLPLGHALGIFEEAQFAAAGVLAAVEVQLRRIL